MEGMFDHLMDDVDVSDKRQRAKEQYEMRQRMAMRVLQAEAQMLFPDRPQMQKLYILNKMTRSAKNSQRDLETLHGIGDNVTNPRAVRM